MGKYFDRVDGLRLRTVGVQSITGFADGGNYYIIFGMRRLVSTIQAVVSSESRL